MFFLTSSYKVSPDPIVILKGGVVMPLIFPKVPQFFPAGILRVPQLPPPLEHPPLKNPMIINGVK